MHLGFATHLSVQYIYIYAALGFEFDVTKALSYTGIGALEEEKFHMR